MLHPGIDKRNGAESEMQKEGKKSSEMSASPSYV